MFNIFKKNQDSIRENLGDFQDSFTLEQKAVIIYALIFVAKSDGHIHPNEMHAIKQTTRILGVDIDDPRCHKVVAKGNNEIIRLLNTLDRSQKEWFLICLHNIAAADGTIEEIEINYALGFAEDIGITEDEYIQIIQQNELLMKSMKL